ncbi:MAG: response regulator [Polyangiales bacterium]|nr:response regulator [Myxococcales bacterium]
MSQRILVLESDDSFATAVRAGFMSLGVDVEVVSDGAAGLERVQAVKPNLILLSIELAGMNGFLVCNKIKKKAELKSIPLLVLSSAPNASDTFDRHRELPTHADDYIKKPISFDDLVERVQKWVELDLGAGGAGRASSPGKGSDSMSPKKDVDAEIDAFADEAFDALVVDSPRSAPPASSAFSSVDEATGVSAPPIPIAEADLVDDADFIELDDDAGLELEDVGPSTAVERRSSIPAAKAARSERPKPASVPPPAAVPAVDTAALDELERKLAAAESRAQEAEKLATELKAQRSMRPPAGASSADILELRGQLNAKEGQLLELKEQVTAREKKIRELDGKNLEIERSKVEIEERLVALEGELDDLKQKTTALEGDKEAASKRASDMKERAERAQARIKQLEEELEQQKVSLEGQLNALEEKHATATARAASAHAGEVEKLRADLDAAVASERGAREKAVAELSEAHEGALSELKAKHSAELATLRDNHATESAKRAAEAEQATDAAVAEATARLTAQLDREKAAAEDARESALTALRAEFETEKASIIQTSEEKHGRELALVGRKLTETESRLDQAYARVTEAEGERDQAKAEADKRGQDVESLRAEIAALKANTDDLRSRLTNAEAKLANDAEVLGRARKAFAIGLSLLEDQQKSAAE